MKVIAALMTFALMLFSAGILAKDVFVRGYTRSDGTYVRPHMRSAPNASRWDNYGPSQSDPELMNPQKRDYDSDGMPNYRDRNDDNDAYLDDSDNSQYGR